MIKNVRGLCGYSNYYDLLRNAYLRRYTVETERFGNINGRRIDSVFEGRGLMQKHLAKLELYKTRHQVDYSKSAKYTSNGLMPGTRIAIEAKGQLRDVTEAQKYHLVIEQNDLALLFIFPSRGIECSWFAKRVDGSRPTLEDSAERQIKAGAQLAYTFEDEMDFYFRTRGFRASYDPNDLTYKRKITQCANG